MQDSTLNSHAVKNERLGQMCIFWLKMKRIPSWTWEVVWTVAPIGCWSSYELIDDNLFVPQEKRCTWYRGHDVLFWTRQPVFCLFRYRKRQAIFYFSKIILDNKKLQKCSCVMVLISKPFCVKYWSNTQIDFYSLSLPFFIMYNNIIK